MARDVLVGVQGARMPPGGLMQAIERVPDRMKKIVVVDDDPDVCETLFSIISAGTRHQVERFTDPLEALERVRSAPCHLVMTDIVMPKMDGIRLLKELKAVRPEVEVIVLTGNASTDFAVGALQHRAYDFLQKPFTATRLLDVLAEALVRQEMSAAVTRQVQTTAQANAELRRRGRHHLGRVASLDRISMARLVYRMLGRHMKTRVVNLSDAVAKLDHAFNEDVRGLTLPAHIAGVRDALTSLKADMAEMSHAPTEAGLCFRASDVIDLVAGRAREFVDYFPDMRLELEMPQAPALFEIDAEALGLVLVNVLLNAVQATGGSGTVKVAVTVGAGGVEIVVSDSGLGFGPIALARATQPFFTTKGEPFAGLGLTLARQIVEEHGGAVVIENIPRGGGLVTLRLPRWRF